MSLQIGENKSRLAYLYESMSSTQKQNTTQTQQSESGSAEDHFSPEVCPILQTFPQKSVCIRRLELRLELWWGRAKLSTNNKIQRMICICSIGFISSLAFLSTQSLSTFNCCRCRPYRTKHSCYKSAQTNDDGDDRPTGLRSLNIVVVAASPHSPLPIWAPS